MRRATGEIVADLMAVGRRTTLAQVELDCEAAHRLQQLAAIDAARPECPTCGGETTTDCYACHGTGSRAPGKGCDECDDNGCFPCPESGGRCDGRMSIERMAAEIAEVRAAPASIADMAALWTVTHSEQYRNAGAFVAALRSVRAEVPE